MSSKFLRRPVWIIGGLLLAGFLLFRHHERVQWEQYEDCRAARIDYSNAIRDNDGTSQRRQRQAEAFQVYRDECINEE